MTQRIRTLILLLVFSLALRLFLIFQVYSGDLNNHMTWAAQILDTTPKNAYYQEYPGVMMPTYPPLSLLNFITSEFIYRQVINSTNYLNKNFSIFPSKIIWAMEDSDFRPAFYKILNIAADLGIGIMIFKFTRKNLLAGLFLLNPAVWYLSSLWGQIDYIPLFFILLSFDLTSHFYFAFAWLTKQTSIIFFPIFALLSYKKLGLKKTVLGFLLQLLLFTLFYSLFTANPISTYLDRLNTGSGSIWINDNAFNLWVFVSQMDKIPDTLFRRPSLVVYALFACFVIYKLIQDFNDQKILYASFLLSAGAFFILTRMHERYFAPALPFLLLLSYKNKKILYIYLLSSIIHLLNLYHWWWYPDLPSVFIILSSMSNIYVLSSVFTIIFIYLVYVYSQKPAE